MGLVLIIPYLIFGILHMKNSSNRPNKNAVRVGYALFAAGIIVLISGVALTRIDLFGIKNVGLKNPEARSMAYWIHIISPVLAIWLYVIHRLAGPRMKWKLGIKLGLGTAILLGAAILLHGFHPKTNELKSSEGEKYFQPSLAKTSTGNFISEKSLMMDDYCLKCHEDIHDRWYHSSHHFSSFNNPFYLSTIEETRDVLMKRDGNVKASRWCAGCHDPVPFFSGKFDNPDYDIINDKAAHAGITCTVCHAITSIDSVKGNADYTISEPIHYPFAYSTNKFLQYVNNQLVKAKPAFHNRMFLKDFMKTEEYCGTCHKVSLPGELTHYKDWMRGQNHYDSFILSGPGHGARSFYFPKQASENCSSCHMPLRKSNDLAANFFNPKDKKNRYVHDHLFASANTALPYLRGDTDIVKAHEEFSKDSLRVDIFGVKDGDNINAKLIAPLRPEEPILEPGKSYLIEIVIRTLRLGHIFPQGTADSNEIWLDIKAKSGNTIIGQSGGLGKFNEVDPFAHFTNVYMLDKNGNRIDRRNAQDIYTPLYNNQMPPGTGFVVHYKLKIPDEISEPININVDLNYRKFDTIYFNHVYGNDYDVSKGFELVNDLPIRKIASDSITLGVKGENQDKEIKQSPSEILEWERWNDYGIGLLLRGKKGANKGELLQAENAFKEVEKLGRPDGPINLARLYIKEGRLNEAVSALNRAVNFNPQPHQWIVAWLSGLVNKQNGNLELAAKQFRSILEDDYPEMRERKLDFSRDYIVINELGLTLFEQAKSERRNPEKQGQLFNQAISRFNDVLEIDPENLTAHYNLALLHARTGDSQKSEFHFQKHTTYKPDDNARDSVVNKARAKSEAANLASQAIVIYDLQREGFTNFK